MSKLFASFSLLVASTALITPFSIFAHDGQVLDINYFDS
jgi:hypothetical protein